MDINIKGTKRTASKLRDIGKLSEGAYRTAEKKALQSGKRKMIKDIGLVLNLSASRIGREIDKDKKAVYIIKGAREKPPTLHSFQGRFLWDGLRSAGYKVRVWRGVGIEYYKPLFKIPGRVIPFVRTGRSRNSPIKPAFGPRVGFVFSQNWKPVQEHMRNRVVIEWRRTIRGRLAR